LALLNRGKPSLAIMGERYKDKRLYSTKSLPSNSPTEVEPVKVYSNADTCKSLIISEKGKAGIYRWVNLTNNKSYIGSAIDLKERWIKY